MTREPKIVLWKIDRPLMIESRIKKDYSAGMFAHFDCEPAPSDSRDGISVVAACLDPNDNIWMPEVTPVKAGSRFLQ